MLANHTYTGSNGKQNCVFPFEYMYLTQGEMTTAQDSSHKGSYAMDFQGYGASGRILRCPYYAPCDMRLVAIADSNAHSYVYTSLQEVNFIDGSSGYLTLLVAHDDTSYSVGRLVKQGLELGRTGTYGISYGDHVHMEVKKGQYEGCHTNSQGTYMLTNSTHIYDLIGVDDTIIIQDGNYNWRVFGDTPIPMQNKRKNFPFVIYSRKRRNKYIY